MYENSFPHKRYQITLDFLKKYVAKNEIILDLGVSNPFSEILINEGFNVNNTLGQDLDLDTSIVTNNDFDVITAFQIFEHMVAPFNVLTAIKTNKLIASVPLNLWFSNAYRNKNDQWDRHYHEFEDWQLIY